MTSRHRLCVKELPLPAIKQAPRLPLRFFMTTRQQSGTHIRMLHSTPTMIHMPQLPRFRRFVSRPSILMFQQASSSATALTESQQGTNLIKNLPIPYFNQQNLAAPSPNLHAILYHDYLGIVADFLRQPQLPKLGHQIFPWPSHI